MTEYFGISVSNQPLAIIRPSCGRRPTGSAAGSPATARAARSSTCTFAITDRAATLSAGRSTGAVKVAPAVPTTLPALQISPIYAVTSSACFDEEIIQLLYSMISFFLKLSSLRQNRLKSLRLARPQGTLFPVRKWTNPKFPN